MKQKGGPGGGGSVLLDQSIPECVTGFHRGDANSSGEIDISDCIAIFGFLFLRQPPRLSCRESADTNNDGTIDIADGIDILQSLFTGGPEPAIQ